MESALNYNIILLIMQQLQFVCHLLLLGTLTSLVTKLSIEGI